MLTLWLVKVVSVVVVQRSHTLLVRLVTKRNASVRMRVKRVSLLPALSYFALSNNTPRDLCMEGNRMIAIIPNPVLHGVPDKSKALKTMRKCAHGVVSSQPPTSSHRPYSPS